MYQSTPPVTTCTHSAIIALGVVLSRRDDKFTAFASVLRTKYYTKLPLEVRLTPSYGFKKLVVYGTIVRSNGK